MASLLEAALLTHSSSSSSRVLHHCQKAYKVVHKKLQILMSMSRARSVEVHLVSIYMQSKSEAELLAAQRCFF
jgi:hypothetical protein